MINSSKKEVFLAIFIGLAAGFIFSYLSFIKKPILKTSFENKKPTQAKSVPSSSPVKKENEVSHLKIEGIENYNIVKNSIIDIKGKAPLDSYLFIFNNDEEKVVEIKSSPDFSAKINLNEGPNEITFLLLKENNEIENQTLTIIYENLQNQAYEN